VGGSAWDGHRDSEMTYCIRICHVEIFFWNVIGSLTNSRMLNQLVDSGNNIGILHTYYSVSVRISESHTPQVLNDPVTETGDVPT
jgi:hypothetical protein